MHRALCGWAAPLVGGLAFVLPTFGQDVTRVDPVLEVQQKLPAEIDPDNLIPVEVRIRNTGRVAADAVSVTDIPKAGVQLVSAEPQGVRSSGTLVWSLGRLEPGQERVIRVRLKRAAGVLDPQFMHSVELTFQATGRNTAETAVRQTTLNLEVAGTGPAVVHTPATLRMTVTNPGTSPVRDVALETLLPDGLEHSHGSDLMRPLGVLEPGQSRTITLNVTPTRVGDLSARLRLTARGMATPVEQTAKFRVTPPPISLVASPPSAVGLEKSALYELVVSNDGADARPGVEVRVTLPKEMTFVRATDRGTYDADARTVRWDLGPVRPGEKRGVVWNGTATAAGQWACPAVLVVDGKVQGEVVCTVRAVAAGGQ